MLGVYFSGTGNTKYCVETFVKKFDNEGMELSIESADVIKEISAHDTIAFGYPIYFSNLPKIVRDFTDTNKKCFRNKKNIS